MTEDIITGVGLAILLVTLVAGIVRRKQFPGARAQVLLAVILVVVAAGAALLLALLIV
jgi:hypothetical protein